MIEIPEIVETVRLCVITEPWKAPKDLNAMKTSLQVVIGAPADVGVTIDGKTDLFFTVPAEDAQDLADRLNDFDYVRLAHFRDRRGRLYPRL